MILSHHNKIKDYVSAVCSQVKFKAIHQDLKLELENHVEEIAEEYLIQGLSEEEAVDRALAQMGEATMVGQQLNRVHKPKFEWGILLIFLLFINIGLMAMYFIQKQGLLMYDNPIFEKSLLYSLLSIIAVIGVSFFDYRKLEKYSLHIYLVTLLLLFITVCWGTQLNGSSSWLNLGPFNVNFVAASPVFFALALAGIFHHWDWNNPFKLLCTFALLGLPLALIMIAPSVSTAAIYIVAFIFLMIAAGAKFKHILLTVGPFLMLLFLSVVVAPYRLERLIIFLNPAADPQGGGYLSMQLHNLISHSGLLGQGLTFNPQLLPEIHTDFVFAFITFTLGWIASIVLVVFIAMFLVRIALIIRQVKLNYGKLIISGFVAIFAVQFLWSILMNIGLAPIGAVSLPFISYGGSLLVVNAAMVGVISSIYKLKNVSH